MRVVRRRSAAPWIALASVILLGGSAAAWFLEWRTTELTLCDVCDVRFPDPPFPVHRAQASHWSATSLSSFEARVRRPPDHAEMSAFHCDLAWCTNRRYPQRGAAKAAYVSGSKSLGDSTNFRWNARSKASSLGTRRW